MNDSVSAHALSDASAKSTALRSKKLCGAPSYVVSRCGTLAAVSAASNASTADAGIPSSAPPKMPSTGAAIRYSLNFASGKGGNWLNVTPSGNPCCYTPTSETVSANASALAAGTYTGEILITEWANPGKSMTIPVVLNVAP